MTRTVKFSLKFKVIALLTFLLTLCISLYVYVALDLFKIDKSADVFSNSLSHAELISEKTDFYFSENLRYLKLMQEEVSAGKDIDSISRVFKNSPGIIEFSLYSKQDNKFLEKISISNKEILDRNQLPRDFFKTLKKRMEIPFKTIEQKEFHYVNQTFVGGIPHLLMGAFDLKTKEIALIRVLIGPLVSSFSSNKVYDAYLVNGDGKYIISKNGAVATTDASEDSSYLAPILNEGIEKGVKHLVSGQGQKIVSAFSKIENFDLFVLSQISEDKAFQAATFLVDKSLTYGLFILSISIIIGIFFSRRLTAHLRQLFSVTQKIAQGDFTAKVSIRDNDEIGVLSDSFNYMTSEILRYMEEMKEKARLENEIKVAQLVQTSFFPNKEIHQNGLYISAYYKTASECGGDWWGSFQIEGKLVIIIADATGHGVPAALLTATAYTCSSNIQNIAKTNPELVSSPSQILSFMNNAVWSIGGEIMLTCFVAMYDELTGELVYSNASHNQPYLYRKSENEPSKNDIEPLISENGPRLGHKESPVYKEEKITIGDEDTLLLFTDGLIEGENVEGKQLGTRRFIKSFLSKIKDTPTIINQTILRDAHQFYEGVPVNDDVTLVCVKKSSNHSINVITFGKTLPDFLSSYPNESNISKLEEFLINKYIIVFTAESIKKIDPRLCQKFGNRMIIIADLHDEEMMTKILPKFRVNHLIGLNGVNPLNELEATVNQINQGAIYYNDFLINAKHFKYENIRSTKNVHDIVHQALLNIDISNYFSELESYVSVLSNELITNALYHSSGKGDQKRSEDFETEENNAINFYVAVDKHRIIVSVVDPKGVMEKDKVIDAIERGFREQRPKASGGGAGLGLYMVYSNSNQFIANVKKGISTQIICIIDSTKRYKKYKERITSFHYFEEGEEKKNV